MTLAKAGLSALVMGITLAAAPPVALPALPGGTEPPLLRETEPLDQVLARAEAELDADNRFGAVIHLLDALRQPGFSLAAPELRYSVYLTLGLLEADMGTDRLGFEHLMQAGAAAPQARDAAYWQAAATLALRLEEKDALLSAVTALARDFPESQADWPNRIVSRAVAHGRGLPAERSGERLDLLAALFAMDYRSRDPYLSVENYWLDLLELYVSRGMEAEARRVAGRLERPDSLIALSIDRRFAHLAPGERLAAHRRALDRSIAEARELAASRPREIRAVYRLASALDNAGQLAEALGLLDAALAKAQPAGDGAAAYDDLAAYQHWTEFTRSGVLLKLGRWEEGRKARERARDLARENGADLATRTGLAVDVGVTEIFLEAPERALAALRFMDGEPDGSFGKASAESVRACALAQTGDAAGAAAALQYVLEYGADDYLPVQMALLCLDDLDRLAGIVVGRIADPATRADMLEELQDYRLPEADTAFGRLMNARFDRLRARSDVREAIDRHGFILDWPVFRASN